MRASWWGTLGEAYFKAFGRPLRRELLSGIPNSPQDHYAAPYAITEEFTAVYRLHSLIPDDFSFRRHGDDTELLTCTLADLFVGKARRASIAKWLSRTSSIRWERAIRARSVLHNFPNHLRRIPEKREQNAFTDLAAIDILRDRERGVPRYCAFRRHPADERAQELRGADRQRGLATRARRRSTATSSSVDFLTGTLAETKPPGFAISDTRFASSSSWPGDGSRAIASSPTTIRPRSTRRRGSPGSRTTACGRYCSGARAGARPRAGRRAQHASSPGPNR